MESEYEVNRELLLGFLDESMEGLALVESLFVRLETEPGDMDNINAIFRPVHSLKGNSAYFGLMKVKELSHKMETVLDALRKNTLQVSGAVIDALLPGVDLLKAMLARVREGGSECAAPEELAAAIAALDNALSGKSAAPVVQAPVKQKDAATEPQKERTMRVSEGSIDSFLGHVGDLVVVEEMFAYLWKKLQVRNDDITKEFRQILHTFSALSNNLRTDILAIRKVEAATLLQKAPRVIRDIAAHSGKNITVTCRGDGLKIDKSYIDLLDAPLLHMARNAADHGIETPEKRAAAGKPKEGNICIELEEKENVLELSIRDDGNGLNYEAISRKAAALGLIAPGDALTDEMVTDLIFASGVSTAETVSDISGRGVGMDVVKRAVESAKGKITIVSVKGKGCTFSVSLPRNVSTRILDGYLVRSGGGEIYVLPMGSVVEAFSADRKELSSVAGKGRMALRHGKLMPVVALGEKLAGHGAVGARFPHPENGGDKMTMVCVKAGKNLCAISVDGILGVQKIVAKPVLGVAVENNIFDGAAMLGDGRVAMIISESGLVKLMGM